MSDLKAFKMELELHLPDFAFSLQITSASAYNDNLFKIASKHIVSTRIGH